MTCRYCGLPLAAPSLLAGLWDADEPEDGMHYECARQLALDRDQAEDYPEYYDPDDTARSDPLLRAVGVSDGPLPVPLFEEDLS